MKQVIWSINELQKNEWIVSGRGIANFKSDKIDISQEANQEMILFYHRNRETKAMDIKNIEQEKYNTYEINHKITCTPGIELTIGVVKCYYTGKSENLTYKIDEEIMFISEGIQDLYLTLKIKGTGSITFDYLNLVAKKVIYWNENVIGIKKLKEFYKYWEKDNEKQGKVLEPTYKVRVATILDQFSYECFKYEADLCAITYENWYKEMEEFRPQMLLVESAWQGKNGSWTNKIARYGVEYDKEVLKLINYCKEKKIPTVFWDKEGLKNFHYFIYTASLFDYVGATDENSLEIHSAMRDSKNVFVLPFAAQTKMHNDSGRMTFPLGNVAFAGSWYGNKYPSRIREMEQIIQPAIPFGLDIYDRNYDKQGILNDEIWKWPKVYQPCIVGKLPYAAMIEAYKQYKIFLNVQSINDSKWMVPRRVYELIACGVPIISSESKGIIAQFKEEIYIARSEEETEKFIKEILAGGESVDKKVKNGIEKILQHHTYTHRMEEILNKVGI